MKKQRKCTKCGKIGEDNVFATFKHKDGRVGRRNVCLECRAEYHIKNYDRLKEYRKKYNEENRGKKKRRDRNNRKKAKAFVDRVKRMTPCADCGQKFPAICMDFDHVGHKNNGVSNMVSQAYKLDLIKEEIKLCEIVCSNCHRIRTQRRKQNLTPQSGKWGKPDEC